MITKNFSNYLYGCSEYSGTRQNRKTASITDLTGDKLETPADQYASTWLKTFTPGPSTNPGAFRLILGNDNTPATPNDYKINEITGVTPLVGDYIFNNGKIRIYRTFANNTDSDITVSEVGLAVIASTSKREKPILISREVLDSEYVIKSGGGTDVRRRHWIDTVLSVLHNMFCTSPVCKEVAA